MTNESNLVIIKGLIILARPHQWIKNIFLFAPLFFTFDFSLDKFITVCIGFIFFSLVASMIYILNDYHDITEDRAHPFKKHRPLASGVIPKKVAIIFIGILLIISFPGAFLLSPTFSYLLLVYIGINIAYTFKLKHISILDITIISIGFILRIYAGAVLIKDTPSMWIVLVTFLLALFLALAKRRDDCLLALEGKKTRKNIDGYNLEMINAAMTLMASVTVVSYIMYTVSQEVISRLGTHNLFITSLFVVVGILRYMQLTFVLQNTGSPTKILMKDKFLQILIIFWLISFYIVVKING